MEQRVLLLQLGIKEGIYHFFPKYINMNWYKKAQLEVLDSDRFKGKGRSYTDYGHDIYYEEQNRRLGNEPNKNYSIDNPNIMWIYDNGQIETKPETDERVSHRSELAWGLSSHLDKLYTGRYSPGEKVITVIPPFEGINRYRGIPSFLQYALKQKFPEAERIIRYM